MKVGICYPFLKLYKIDNFSFDFIEESVIEFLKPEKPKTFFMRNFYRFKKGSIPIPVANQLFPKNLKIIGNSDKKIIERYLRIVFERARMIGIKLIVLGSGRSRSIPQSCSIADCKKEFISKLKHWGDLAGEYNIKIAVEPLCKRETNFLNTLEETAELVYKVKHPNVGLTADLYHMRCENEPVDVILSAGEIIWHVHVAEYRNRAAPGYYGEDFTNFFRALKDIGYNGLISIEAHWQDSLNEIDYAVSYIKKQWINA
ncbi:MAG: hypothetical protein DRZ80_02715 [Thermoprotei archaeon]|nr:MAG: hypothetical protein DRZ80_02715 [Thermoprotei archaeon]